MPIGTKSLKKSQDYPLMSTSIDYKKEVRAHKKSTEQSEYAREMRIFAIESFIDDHTIAKIVEMSTSYTPRVCRTTTRIYSSLDVVCPKLTTTDITELTGIICRENGYDVPMFGYIHAAMKYYLEINAEELKHSTGEDVARYFREVAPIAYRHLKKANVITVKDACKFRDGPKDPTMFHNFF